MIAVDTNILARYLLNDERKQAQIAAAIVEGDEDLTAPVTVFLELVWVLESYGYTRAEVARALTPMLPRKFSATRGLRFRWRVARLCGRRCRRPWA